MCFKGKCMHCLEVETWSLIYAIFNIIGVSLGCVAAIGGWIYTNLLARGVIQKAETDKNEKLREGVLDAYLIIGMALAILTVILLISFAFAVVLLVGLRKRKANLVKCYFIFGVVIMAIVGSTFFGFILYGTPIDILQIIIIFSIFFAPILLMIRRTYKKFETEAAYIPHKNPISVIQKF